MHKLTAASGYLLLALGGPKAARAQSMRDAYGPHIWDGSEFGMSSWPIILIFVTSVAIVAVALLVVWRRVGMRHAPPPAAQSVVGTTPIDILRERFARGDIDKNEFDERRKILGD